MLTPIFRRNVVIGTGSVPVPRATPLGGFHGIGIGVLGGVGNRVEDNVRMGILHEISYAIVIRNNTVRRNGFGLSSWVWGAGIVISSSSNAEVYGNIVEDNAGGIVGVQQNRGSGAHGAR